MPAPLPTLQALPNSEPANNKEFFKVYLFLL